jgi:hypothetical protein
VGEFIASQDADATRVGVPFGVSAPLVVSNVKVEIEPPYPLTNTYVVRGPVPPSPPPEPPVPPDPPPLPPVPPIPAPPVELLVVMPPVVATLVVSAPPAPEVALVVALVVLVTEELLVTGAPPAPVVVVALELLAPSSEHPRATPMRRRETALHDRFSMEATCSIITYRLPFDSGFQ